MLEEIKPKIHYVLNVLYKHCKKEDIYNIYGNMKKNNILIEKIHQTLY